MLSIGKIRNPAYYLKFTRYYLLGGEPPGQWVGSAAKRLGLDGTVLKRHFERAFLGLSPRGKSLNKMARKNGRCAGWDLTFSAPKGISVLWALAPKRQRRLIRQCHDRAVQRAIRFLQEQVIQVRRGKNGTRKLPAELLGALFQHSSSRSCDMDLHSHLLVFSLAFANGRWSAVDGKQLYRFKMAAGAIYRAELVHLISKTLGLPFERIKTWVELKGVVPERVLRFFSKRSEELRKAMQLYGADSARAADIANLRTRKAKRNVSRRELFRQWRREAAALGFGPELVAELLKTGQIGSEAQTPQVLADILHALDVDLQSCIAEIMERHAHFPRRMLIERFVPVANDYRVSADVALLAIDRALTFDRNIVDLKKLKGEVRYTTQQNLEREQTLKTLAGELKGQPAPFVSQSLIEDTKKQNPKLSSEQASALEYLLGGPGRIKALAGVPGSGKTSVLAAAKDAWQRLGVKAVGCAISGKAARNLQEKSDITSSTVVRLQMDLDAAEQAKAIEQSSFGLATYPLTRLELDQNTVVIVDEAGMVDTANFLDLCERIHKAGAVLVIVGDEHQLPPIGAGAPFDAIKKELIHTALTETRRLSDPIDRDVLHLIRTGNGREALEKYRERDLLFVGESRHEAHERLIADWVRQGGVERPQDHVVLVGTNAQRQYLNDKLQALRQETGAVAKEGQLVQREMLAQGDRVMFLKNSITLDVKNGEIGTVIKPRVKGERCLTVELDTGREVDVSLDRYDHLTRAYAATVHKFQGADVRHTYAVMGGSMQSLEFTHTQLSRHEITCRIYTDKIEAGENLERLARQISTPSRECLAIDLLPAPSADPPTSGPEFRDGSKRALRQREHAAVGDVELADPLAKYRSFDADETPSKRHEEKRSLSQVTNAQLPRELRPGYISLRKPRVATDVADGPVQPTPSVANDRMQIQPRSTDPPRQYIRLVGNGPPKSVPSPSDIDSRTGRPIQQSHTQMAGEADASSRPLRHRISLQTAGATTSATVAVPENGEAGAPLSQRPEMTVAERGKKPSVSEQGDQKQVPGQASSANSPRLATSPRQVQGHIKSPPSSAVPTIAVSRADLNDARAFDLRGEVLPAVSNSMKSSAQPELAVDRLQQSPEPSRPQLQLVASDTSHPAPNTVPSSNNSGEQPQSRKQAEETLLQRELRLRKEHNENEHCKITIDPPTNETSVRPKPS